MSTFGEHLRRQRELRGISLEEIVATTKIGRRLLLALEEEQFDLLPGGIFNKSYVRAYAKCVGLNEEQTVAEYLEAAKEVPPDTRVIAQQHESIHSDRRRQRYDFPWLPVLVLLVIVAGGLAGWRLYQDHFRQREKAAAETTPLGSAAPAPSHSTSTAAASQIAPSSQATAATSTGQPFEVTVRPKDAAWVSIKSDGKYVVRGILKPPDIKTIRASNQVVFFTGNAGAVDVAFNGKNVPLTGGPNDEQILVFGVRGLLPKAAAQ